MINLSEALAEIPSPTIADLGGIEVIAADGPSLADYLFSDRLVAAISQEPSPLDPGLVDILFKVLAENSYPLVLASSCAHASRAALSSDEIRTAQRTLIGRVQDRSSPLLADIASESLAGAFLLANGAGGSRPGVVAALDEIQATDPPTLVRRAAKIAGLAWLWSRSPDLQAILDRLSRSEEGGGQALLELGLVGLDHALVVSSSSDMVAGLRIAAETLDRAAYADPDLSEAEALRSAVWAVIYFLEGEEPDHIESKISMAIEASLDRALFLDRSALRAWLRTSVESELAWHELAASLAGLTERMDQRSWLHAVPVLQQIGAVRTALISVANDSGDALREAVTEKFARSFLARDGLAAHLTDWAENTHTTDIDREHARALLSALDDAREKASGNSDGLANTSAAASPTLPASSEFEELERWAEFARSRSLTGKLEDVFLSIDEELSTHPDYRGDVKADCRSIVHHLILYMAHCLDVTPRMADAGYGFLFDLDGTKPLELDLQRSLWTNFRLQNHGFPQHQILREVQDVGAGRADIAIVRSTWRPVLELKREPNNASRENIRAYLGQAAAYELTGPRIGFLVVLDVCSQKDWALTIEDNVWVERVQSSDDSQPRLITVWRIPGMRTTPSSVKTPNGG